MCGALLSQMSGWAAAVRVYCNKGDKDYEWYPLYKDNHKTIQSQRQAAEMVHQGPSYTLHTSSHMWRTFMKTKSQNWNGGNLGDFCKRKRKLAGAPWCLQMSKLFWTFEGICLIVAPPPFLDLNLLQSAESCKKSGAEAKLTAYCGSVVGTGDGCQR